jgi:MFS family permease
MLPLIVPILALLSGVALLLLGSGLLSTLLAIRGGLEGFDDRLLGAIMSCYFVGFLIGNYLAPGLIRRMGHIRAFAFCAAILSCSVLLHGLFIHPLAWIALRMLTGLMLVVLYTVIESWLNGQTSGEYRGRVFAVYMVVTLLSLAAAQQFLRLGSPLTFTLFALASILVTLALTPVVWTRMIPPPVHDAAALAIAKLHARAPSAAAGAMLSGLAMSAFWGMGPVFAGRIGLDAGGIATFMTVVIVGGACLQIPLGRFSDKHDRALVLIVIAIAAAVAAAMLAGIGHWGGPQRTLAIYTVAFLYGGFAFAVYPVAVAHLIDNLLPNEVLAGSGGLLLLYGFGAALGPALAGLLMGTFGAAALPAYFVAVQLLLAAYTFVQIRVRAIATRIEGHPAHFVPMVRTTPAVLELHPDQPETESHSA